MQSIRIGLGALVVAVAAYAGTGLAATGTGASQRQQQEGSTQHREAGKSASARSSAATRERTATGRVKAIDARALTLANGEQLRIGSKTEFMSGQKKISRQDVKQGEQVRASYEPHGKLAYADRVVVVSTKSGASSGAKSQ